jgi:hypothetical protein
MLAKATLAPEARRDGRISRMARFYDIDEANARLADLRPVLESLRADRNEIAATQAELTRFRGTNGNSDHASELKRREDELRRIVRRMQAAVAKIEGWGITLREIETGLVDFPALVNGRPIWLCWRLGEDAVGFWHGQDTGFANRKPLIDLA